MSSIRRDIAVVAFTQSRHTAEDAGLAEVEILAPVITEIKEKTGLTRFGFTCSGSNDYLSGLPFSFVSALDAVGAWPPISESHVEMDGAWALYEAWVKLLHGETDTALVYGFGKPSQGDLREITTQGLDPYYLAPLGVDHVSLGALQARAYMERSGAKEDDLRA
ncbi:lipid-transfer protein, partial [Actinomadura adrarensis]